MDRSDDLTELVLHPVRIHVLGEAIRRLIEGCSPFPGRARTGTSKRGFTDAMAERLGTGRVALLGPVPAGLVLLGYAAVAAGAAVLVPLRRDVG